MGKIIELCGSPGVGKSSIFFELEKRENKKNKWTTASNTNPYGKISLYDFVGSILMKIKTGIPQFFTKSNDRRSLYDFARFIYREIKNGKNFVDLDAMKEDGDRFVAQNPNYIEACWGNILPAKQKARMGWT